MEPWTHLLCKRLSFKTYITWKLHLQINTYTFSCCYPLMNWFSLGQKFQLRIAEALPQKSSLNFWALGKKLWSQKSNFTSIQIFFFFFWSLKTSKKSRQYQNCKLTGRSGIQIKTKLWILVRGNIEIIASEEIATEKQNSKPKTSQGETADFGLVCVYQFLKFQFHGSKLTKQLRTSLKLALLSIGSSNQSTHELSIRN